MAGLRRHSRPAAAIISQGISSISSLVLALIAARVLGAEGLGEFAILFSVVITFNSVTTGYVGDSLTVLDRFDPPIRKALFGSAGVATLAGVLTALVTAFALGLGLTTAVAFALALVAWVWEEFGRRLLVTRLEFWKLAANDTCYASIAIGLAAVLALVFHNLTLTTLLLAMAVGSAAAWILAVAQLPRAEFAFPRRTRAAFRQLNQFAAWRAAQTTIRPLSMSVIRISVAAVATTAALGNLEGARILATPMTTLISGASTFLLPMMAAEERGETGGTRLPVVRVSLLLGAVSLAVGLVCVLLVPVLGPLLLGDEVQVDQWAALFWALFAAAFGLGIPLGNALVAMKKARLTFWIRAGDAAIGVGVGTLLAWWIDASFAPLGLMLGALVGAYWCYAALRREGRV